MSVQIGWATPAGDREPLVVAVLVGRARLRLVGERRGGRGPAATTSAAVARHRAGVAGPLALRVAGRVVEARPQGAGRAVDRELGPELIRALRARCRRDQQVLPAQHRVAGERAQLPVERGQRRSLVPRVVRARVADVDTARVAAARRVDGDRRVGLDAGARLRGDDDPDPAVGDRDEREGAPRRPRARSAGRRRPSAPPAPRSGSGRSRRRTRCRSGRRRRTRTSGRHRSGAAPSTGAVPVAAAVVGVS